MADDRLRLEAEVIDRFTGPLKKLRDGLRGIRTPDDLKRTQAAMEGVKKGAELAATAVRSTLGTALTALGVTSISVGGALAGLFAAAKSFGASAAELKFFSQEVDVSARNIRRLENFGANFNVSSDQVRSGIGKVSESMRELRKGYGDLADFLRRIDPALFNQLRGTKDNDEAMGRLLGYMDRIPNAADRAAFSMKVFGTTAFARMRDIRQGLGNIDRDVAAPTEQAMKAAQEFLAAWNRIGNIFEKIKVQVGTEVIPMFNEWLDGLGNKLSAVDWNSFAKQIGDSIREVKKYLEEIDWKGIGDDLMRFAKNFAAIINGIADGVGLIVSGLKTALMIGGGASASDAENLAIKERQLAGLDRRIGSNPELADELRRQRDLLASEIKTLREKMRENVKEGVKEGMQGLIQQQSFGGGASGWGAGGLFHNASYGPGGAGGGPFQRIPRIARLPSSGGVGGDEGTGSPGGEVVAAGPGWTRIRLADGSVVERRGTRSWRNFNAGNVEYGPFARRHGAIGTDGRFAVFPDQETGDRAREALLFATRRYRDGTIAQAISRYAPPSENNTGAYLAAVLRGIGGGVGGNTPMLSLTPEQRKAMLDAMKLHEGWRAGRQAVLSPPTASPFQPSLSRLGDDLMRSRFANPEIKGRAGIDINLNGFPKGTRVNTSTEGIFQDVRLDRGRQLGALMA